MKMNDEDAKNMWIDDKMANLLIVKDIMKDCRKVSKFLSILSKEEEEIINKKIKKAMIYIDWLLEKWESDLNGN